MLDTRVSGLETRVDKLEHAAPPPPVWSCAASCLTSYSCKTNGENTVEWTQKTGVGTTAAEAFLAMTAKCDATVFVDGRCRRDVRADAGDDRQRLCEELSRWRWTATRRAGSSRGWAPSILESRSPHASAVDDRSHGAIARTLAEKGAGSDLRCCYGPDLALDDTAGALAVATAGAGNDHT